MKKAIFLFGLLFSINLSGQGIVESIPKVYHSASDTIYFKWSAYPDTYNEILIINDTVSPGTNGQKDIVLYVFFGKDTLKLPYKNFPYSSKSFVTVETPKGKGVIAFRYNSVSAVFPESYIEHNIGKVSVEVPEVYELANIIWSLSPSGKRASDLYKKTKYYTEAENYFKPFMDHPVFKKLDFPEKDYSENYYDFRENSFAFKFDGDRIVGSDIYNYVMGGNYDDFNSLFKELSPLVEDFARKSNYKRFYMQHSKYYSDQISKATALLPVQNMWAWLEKEFPGKKLSSYKIVFSPLIGGSHSTQQYYTKSKKTGQWFGECVMFICGPDRYEGDKNLSEQQKKGMYSGIVFTEIDHNYVNPQTSKHEKDIYAIFNRKGFWSSEKEQWYDMPVSVFNEYMTHSVFCLWVRENFDEKAAAYVIEKREELNVKRRNFIKFKEFNHELLSLRKQNPGLSVAELYPKIIEWCKKQ